MTLRIHGSCRKDVVLLVLHVAYLLGSLRLCSFRDALGIREALRRPEVHTTCGKVSSQWWCSPAAGDTTS
jgi:hypothetical protein